MNDSAEHRRAVLRRARRALEQGTELPQELPETIRCSWARSRLAAAPMDRIAVPYVAVDVAAERLLRAARPVLDRFGQQLAGTHVSLVLADPDGRVVGRWAGDKPALRTWSSPGCAQRRRRVFTSCPQACAHDGLASGERDRQTVVAVR